MKNSIFILLISISSFCMAQGITSIELSNKSFNDFFQVNEIKDYTVLFVIDYEESVSLSDGSDFGMQIKNGKKLVIFIPTYWNNEHLIKYSGLSETEYTITHATTKTTTTPLNLHYYESNKLLFTYKL